MRKNLFLILAIAFATTMSAQFYAGLGVGYGLGANKRVLGTEITATTTTNIYGSFAQGFNIQPKLGYMFNDNMGFELGINYFMGAETTMNEWTTGIEEGQTTGLILLPQFVLRTKIGVYSRVGLYMPVSGSTIITKSDSDMNGDGTNINMEKEGESIGSFSLGIVGAIGYNVEISEQMTFFAELQYSSLSMKSGTYELTKYEVGGQDQLANMSTMQKEVEFVDEVSSTDNTDPNVAYKALKQTSPFSSVGINVGITYSF